MLYKYKDELILNNIFYFSHHYSQTTENECYQMTKINPANYHS